MSAILKKSNRPNRSLPLSREHLAKLRLKAKRKGCWYRVLKQKERMLYDLTINVVVKVRSFLLAKVISKIVERLFEAMQSPIYRLVKSKGQEMAQHVSQIGQEWGNKLAKSWKEDVGFMQFLVVTNLESLGVR